MQPLSKQSLLDRRNVLFNTIKFYITFPDDDPVKSASGNLLFLFYRLININQIYHKPCQQKK